MTRFCLSFLAGSLLTCAGAIAADYRTGIMFIAGGILLLVLQIALLASLSRARAFARFINAVCDGLDGRRRKVEPEALTPRVKESRQDQIAAALRTFGMNRAKARARATEAVEAGGTFPEMIRRATGAPEGEEDELDDLFGPRKPVGEMDIRKIAARVN
jgi:hypothetical protein